MFSPPPFKLFVLAGTALISTTALSPAQTIFTAPAGFVTFDLEVGFNVNGLNVHHAPSVAGVFESETTGTNGNGEATVILTDNDIDFTAVLTSASAQYLLEINDGTSRGTVAEISEIGTNTITIVTDSALSAGTSAYLIREAMTLRQIFGEDTSPKLQSGNAASADIIWVPDGTGNYKRYFYRSAFGSVALRDWDDQLTALGPVPVFYPDGILLQIKDTAKEIPVFGTIKKEPTVFAALNGFSVVTVPSPTGQTLAESGLSSVLASGSNAANADVVWMPDGSGDYTKYFYRNAFGSTAWRLVDDPLGADQESATISGAILIERKGADTYGLFQLPAEFANF